MTNKGKSNILIKFAVLISLLIFLNLLGFLKPISTITVKIFNPILSGFYSLGSEVRTIYNRALDKGNLAEAVKQLGQERNYLLAENARLSILEEENKALRASLNFSIKNKRSLVLSNIIAREEDGSVNGNQNFIIDKGSRDEVINGLAVVDGEGVVIGKIISIQEHLAEVCLVNNEACKFAATFQFICFI